MKEKEAETRTCPICGSESWPIAYGMMPPHVIEENPKVSFAGCVISPEVRINEETGELESGVAEWACQNEDCRHTWW